MQTATKISLDNNQKVYFATLSTPESSSRLAPRTKKPTPKKPTPALRTKKIIPKMLMSALKHKNNTFDDYKLKTLVYVCDDNYTT